MRPGQALRRDLIIGSVIGCLAVAGFARAHNPTEIYHTLWRAGNRDQRYEFARNFPVGALRARVEDAARGWNHLGPTLHFERGGTMRGRTIFQDCSSAGKGHAANTIYWEQIDGQTAFSASTWAQTTYCLSRSGRAIRSIAIRFDKQEKWYKGRHKPGSRLDMWSAATHEWGHASGFGLVGSPDHFAEVDGTCPSIARDSPDRETMCPSSRYGTVYERSPGLHDRHTFAAAYR